MSTLPTCKTAKPHWAELQPRLIGTSLIDRMWKAIATFLAHRAVRRAEAELMALDDRTLKDMGFDRSEIRSVLTDLAQERRRGAQPGR